MITEFDHVVLTVADVERSIAFYAQVLRMTPVTFGEDRRALRFGDRKINLQTLGMERRNNAATGSGDLCLLTDWPLARVIAHLAAEGVAILEGPVVRSGARGPIRSVYFNDPDGNLIEISTYDTSETDAARVVDA